MNRLYLNTSAWLTISLPSEDILLCKKAAVQIALAVKQPATTSWQPSYTWARSSKGDLQSVLYEQMQTEGTRQFSHVKSWTRTKLNQGNMEV